MYLNIFKTFLTVVLLCSCAFAQGIIFKLPDGWEMNKNFSKKGEYLVFTPKSSGKHFIESLKVVVEKTNLNADKFLGNNLSTIKKEYPDFKIYKPLYKTEEALGLGCSSKGGFCIIQRTVKQDGSMYVYSYINTKPHYSQGLLGKWTNICAQIRTENELPLKENEEFFEL